MSPRRCVVVMLLCVATPSGASAQSGPACEIHLWPGDRLRTLTEGWIRNNVQDSAFRNERERLVPAKTPLDPAGQLAIMMTTDPATIGMANAKLVPHAQPRAGDGATRPVTPTCYAELEVQKLFYVSSPFAGRGLRVLFRLQTFGAGQTLPVRSFSTFAETPLIVFPAKTPDQIAAADAELASAFKTSLVKFVGYATRPAPRARR